MTDSDASFLKPLRTALLCCVVLVFHETARSTVVVPCSTDFAVIAEKSKALATIVSEPTRMRLTAEAQRLAQAIAKDTDEAKLDAVVKGDGLVDVKLGTYAKVSINRLTEAVRAELEAQGLIVKSVRAPATSLFRDNHRFLVPEREILVIRAGSSQSPLAREIGYGEKYLASRINDPTTPDELRSIPDAILFDPTYTALESAQGFWSTQPNRAGLYIGPGALIGNLNDLSETISHELRHAKNYFDIVSGKPTVFRGDIIDHTKTLFEKSNDDLKSLYRNYGSGFSFDEINGFLANARKSQTQLRRANENDGKKRKDFETRIEFVRKFSAATRAQAVAARSVLLRNAKDIEKLKSKIRISTTLGYPKNQRLRIDISPEGSNTRFLNIYVPDTVVANGLTAQIDYTLKYLDQLEARTLEVDRELLVREQMSRSTK